MELKDRVKTEVDLQFLDEESGVHVKVQENIAYRQNKDKYFAVSVHIDNDTYYSTIDLSCPTLDEAKQVAEKAFEFFKSVKPMLCVKVKYHCEDADHDCHTCSY